MHELVLNLHMHTRYSDGSGTHSDLAEAALNTGLDVIIVTDHNILVSGLEGYHTRGKKRVLVLVGEEIHDPTRQPQKNHLLVVGASRELATFGSDSQKLIDQVRKSGGLSFIAHPFDLALENFGEADISWEDWNANGFTGLELWNAFSELKSVIHSRLDALFYAFFPEFIARGPLPQTLKKWDEILAVGRRVVAVGGTDAHALTKSLGPLKRTLFPYYFHFQTVNNHLLVPKGLSGDLIADRRMVYEALRLGHNFIGYDLPASTRGFHFGAQTRDKAVIMGDEIEIRDGVTFQIRLPDRADCRLLKDGKPIKTWHNREILTHVTNQPGVYRVECSHHYLTRYRGWIYSNPIFVRPGSHI